MSDTATCSVGAPTIVGKPGCPCASSCACKVGSLAEAIGRFLDNWRRFAREAPETAEQAQALLPGFTIEHPEDFARGYKRGVLAKCTEIENAGSLVLDHSGSVGTTIGFFDGAWRGENDCLKAYADLLTGQRNRA